MRWARIQVTIYSDTVRSVFGYIKETLIERDDASDTIPGYTTTPPQLPGTWGRMCGAAWVSSLKMMTFLWTMGSDCDNDGEADRVNRSLEAEITKVGPKLLAYIEANKDSCGV